MKLYYSAGSCSMSCHIALEEGGFKYEAIEVDFENANDPNLALIEKLNPLGTLPVFITEEGKQLDQNLAIQVYLAEKSGNTSLLPKAGTIEHAQALNWLTFVATDLHKGIGGLFSVNYISQDDAVKAPVRKFMLDKANEYLSYVNTSLEGKNYLTGKDFTAADGYAFVVIGWTKWLEIPLTPYKNIEAYMTRIAARPAVANVLKAEGLI